MLILSAVVKNKNFAYIFGTIISVFILALFSTTNISYLLKATTLTGVNHAPFDGTVYPYLHGVDWVNMTEAERDLHYDQLPASKKIIPPTYSAANLVRTFQSLGFDSSKDKEIRNEKITYTVPYMGTYELDGHEFAGSHPAVDIVLPIGTPILSIANGVVVKADIDEYGFGKHVVVVHKNVPDINDPNKSTTYYSSYSHLNSYNVSPGTVVTKGQVIGYSGDSGAVTTPHLHFQIDKDKSVWHPYWPFTNSEVNSAGLNFFTAINAGLGRQNAVDNTIHPMLYVQKYLTGSPFVEEFAEVDEPKDLLINNETTTTDADTTDLLVESENTDVLELSDEIKLPELSLNAPKTMVMGKSYDIELKFDSGDSRTADVSSSNFDFDPSLPANFTVPQTLSFSAGAVSIPFEPKAAGELDIRIAFGGVEANLNDIEVKLFRDISNTDVDFDALSYLKKRSIVNGYEDLSFRPDGSVSRAEALKFLGSVVNFKDQPTELYFNDVSKSDWFYQLLVNASVNGAVATDGVDKFNPSRGIKLPEYLKMVFIGLAVDVDPEIGAEYSNVVDSSQWYAPYIQEALRRGVIESSDVVNISKDLSRRDIAKITYRFVKMIDDGSDVFAR